MKLRRLDTCNDWKVVRWCRMQASSHNLQDVVDGGVNEVGVSTVAPNRTLQLNKIGIGWLFVTLLIQRPDRSQQATSGVRRVMLASSEVTQVWTVREQPVQRYYEIFRLGAEGQGFAVEVDFQLMLSILVVEMEDC